MTADETNAIDGLIRSLERAAELAEIQSRTLLTVLDGGGRDLLPKEQAAELDELIGNAGVACADFRALARLSRATLFCGKEDA